MTTTTTASGTSAQRQFLVSVKGIPAFWAQKTGGEVASDTSDAYDGGQLVPEKLAGPPTTGNITLTRPYKAARDQDLVQRLRPVVGRWRSTVSVQPTDADLIPIGKADVYPDALLIRVTTAEVDAASGDPSTVELEFAASRVA